MIRKILHILDRKSRELMSASSLDITDPVRRRRSYRQVLWLDHGILRKFWHNFEKIGNDAYRSNHPDHRRFEVYAAMGIKTILNLRGVLKGPHYLFEEESCERLGLNLVTVHMSAREAPKKQKLIDVIDAFRTMERPFLMHCKSGADRTGLVAALYLMIEEGKTVEEARKQLSFRYFHIRRTSTGVLDHFLDVYAARNTESPISIQDWIETEYDRDALTESFATKRASLKPWQGWL